MRNNRNLISAFIALFAFISLAGAQDQSSSVKPSVAAGDVVSVGADKIVLNTKDGALDVTISSATEFKRVPPETPNLRSAVASQLSDIAVGDKLLVTGIYSADRKTLPARAVYLMTKADIAKKQSADSERWTKGIAGKVKSVDPQAGTITVEMRGLMNATSVTVTPKANAEFRRYAPNSFKYSDSVKSQLSDIKPGDMFRAAGERSADGTAFTADEILTGAFRTLAGTVKSVDVAKNEVVIADMQSKSDVTIDLGTASMMKKFPDEFAQRMAQMQGGAGAGAAGGQRPQGAPTGAAPANGAGRPMGGGGMRGGIDEMIERFPTITAADLKPGDVIAVSSSAGATPDRVRAIKLLAGVEPFLRIAQMQAAMSSMRDQSSPSLNIPGLDGPDMP